MDDFMQACALLTIKQQCLSLRKKKINAIYVENKDKLHICCVHIHAFEKIYRFSDPDLNVIISQICTLYARISKEFVDHEEVNQD